MVIYPSEKFWQPIGHVSTAFLSVRNTGKPVKNCHTFQLLCVGTCRKLILYGFHLMLGHIKRFVVFFTIVPRFVVYKFMNRKFPFQAWLNLYLVFKNVVTTLEYCKSWIVCFPQKYPCPPSDGSLGILKGEWGMKGQRQEVWGETGIFRGVGSMDIFWITTHFFILETILKNICMTIFC